MTIESDIHIRQERRALRITLNRPKVLNALTYEMLMAIETALIKAAVEDTIQLVVIDAAGDRAFCAGGDIQDLYNSGRAGDFGFGRTFWADEYRINAMIRNYAKPYVAIMDGIVMGGGVGVSAHGSHRIVTERTMLAMPECSIGLVPDVGASLILAEADHHLGEFVGLTGFRLKAAEAISVGFADYYVPANEVAALIAELCETGDVAAIRTRSRSPGDAFSGVAMTSVSGAFGQKSIEDICTALQAFDDDWGMNTLKMLQRGSPISLAACLEIIREVRSMPTIERALQMEYRFVSRCMEHGEFLEGIRAAIIDKDRSPSWLHDGPDGAPAELIAEILSVPTSGDLVLTNKME